MQKKSCLLFKNKKKSQVDTKEKQLKRFKENIKYNKKFSPYTCWIIIQIKERKDIIEKKFFICGKRKSFMEK